MAPVRSGTPPPVEVPFPVAELEKPASTFPRHAVVVGFGMVGIAFVEKLLNYDIKGNHNQWRVTVIGEEHALAYNRVGLSQYFASRDIESLYLNPLSWYKQHTNKLAYHTGDLVTLIDHESKKVKTQSGREIDYDVCVVATGSNATVLSYISPDRTKRPAGAFVYRTVEDLVDQISYAESRPIKRAGVVGGGLLGLEAAHALLQIGVPKVTIIERDPYILGRQVDAEGSSFVLKKVQALGVDVMTNARLRSVVTCEPSEDADGKARVQGVLFEGANGEPDDRLELEMIVFAIGVIPRDDLAKASGIPTAPRGGLVVSPQLATSIPDVYAIGECASVNGQCFGLIAPGVEQAEVLAFNLTEGPSHSLRNLSPPDLSTKLKLLGTPVASFGSYMADKGITWRPLPGPLRNYKPSDGPLKDKIDVLTFRDPFGGVYKRYLFTLDGKYLVGGIMVGEDKDYVKLSGLTKKEKPLDMSPAELIVGAKKEGEEEGADLDDDAQVCSCHNVTKKSIVDCVKDGARALGDIKSQTKCGTGCGGCVPLMTSLFNSAMKAAGAEISNNLCPHFAYSRQDLFTIIKFRKLKDFTAVMKAVGKQETSLGCEVCRPAVGSILSSLYNEWIMKTSLLQTQDTNDRSMANMQRDGTYSVVPRLPGGEVTPESLRVISEVATTYGLYTKITGGQRIDMFGAKKQDLPSIWEKLTAAGLESGHAYGKSLRTVKSCVGSTWCRYGVGDSVGFAVELEKRYAGLRAPHKFKSGVSGCVRECAEAQSKDFGLIATTKGWNVFVGGNGGAKPRHAELLAADVTRHEAVRLLDRFLIYYIRSADKLERTARWIERLPGGLQHLKEVLIEDKLGICADLEQEMDDFRATYHCEWTKTVQDPEQRKRFRQFVNTDETQEHAERITERGQRRPADWPTDTSPLKFSPADVVEGAQWEWRPVCKLADVEPNESAPTSAVVKYGDTQIAIWHLPGHGLRASQNMCPHRKVFALAEGLVGENEKGPYISCPMHKRNFQLDAKVENGGGSCSDPDYSIMTFDAKSEDGKVLLYLPPSDALDAVLSTTKWMIRKAEEESEAIAGGAGQAGGVSIAGFSAAVEDEAKEAKLVAAGVDPTAAAAAKKKASGGGGSGAGCGGDSTLDW
ncbi:hypothetical protein OC835_001131 [Tilletia horrida]|nr:hypothetical protein OC835_001131 [Tilletia horrida]